MHFACSRIESSGALFAQIRGCRNRAEMLGLFHAPAFKFASPGLRRHYRAAHAANPPCRSRAVHWLQVLIVQLAVGQLRTALGLRCGSCIESTSLLVSVSDLVIGIHVFCHQVQHAWLCLPDRLPKTLTLLFDLSIHVHSFVYVRSCLAVTVSLLTLQC